MICKIVLPALAAALFFWGLPVRAPAQAVFVQGQVLDGAGRPVAGASVRIEGENLSLSTRTDGAGDFTFTTLTVGSYRLTASKGSQSVSESAEVSSAGLRVNMTLASLGTIARAVVTGNPVARRSGTDLAIGGAQLERMPSGTSLPSILTQLPSAATGSNGQVHINGDHNGINYYLDGVQVPSNLNRVLGTEIDPSDIGYLEVLEGAYPAQYGDRFAAVLNVGTRAFAGTPGFDSEISGGSFGTYDGIFGGHTPLGSQGGSISFASRLERSDWAIDPAVANPVHDAGSDANQFLRISLPVNGADTINFDAIHSLQTFQIPPDVANGVPATTDDDEFQDDTFLALQYRHAIGERGVLQFGPSFKASSILDTNDPSNDLAAAQGAPCTDFTDCVFSVYANRRALDSRFNIDFALQSGAHEIRSGLLYGVTDVTKDYAITMQPDNALNPGGGTGTVTDTAPNIGHEEEAYLQDSWRMGSAYELDYGLRADAFQLFSTDFDDGFSQVSPRLKFTRFFGPRSSLYVYYGRLFEPFSFENVNPSASAALYLAPPPNTFDLKPQRDSLYEIGGHLPIGAFDLGVRIMHKVSTDWIDDTQIGATNLHQDINFPQGRVDAQSLYVQQNLARNGRFYLSVTHSIALNSLVCETNLLQNCTLGGYTTGAGGVLVPYYVSPGGGLVEADHDQHWDANAGILTDNLHGGWFSLDGEYGSGLSTGDPEQIVPGTPTYAYAYDAACANGNAVNCKVPPHLVFNVEDGVQVAPHLAIAVTIDNLFNDRYAITFDSTLQGTHYARPRSVTLDLRLSQ